jgi:hypothetical protein
MNRGVCNCTIFGGSAIKSQLCSGSQAGTSLVAAAARLRANGHGVDEGRRDDGTIIALGALIRTGMSGSR